MNGTGTLSLRGQNVAVSQAIRMTGELIVQGVDDILADVTFIL